MARQTSRSMRWLRQLLAGASTAIIIAFAGWAPAALAQKTTEPADDPISAEQATDTSNTSVGTDDRAAQPEEQAADNAQPGQQPSPTTSAPTTTSTDTPETATAPTAVPDPAVTPPAAAATHNTAIEQNTRSTATSGDATVKEATVAGDATSGTANATATVINVVHSASGLSGSAPVTFVQDITGDIQGDITIDPFNLLSQPSGTSTVNIYNRPDTASSIDIVNNVDLTARSGNATVGDNSQAGNATSGDADALANIINLVNSSVGSARSFVGVVNIHGNLTGDILVPASFVNSLLASDGLATEDTGGNTAASTPRNLGSLDSTVNITNTVNLDAVSGNATVSGNQSAGDATSGNALTNLKVYNLTGQQVVAKNSLLVFVNVLGEWVGMIVPAPNGSTSAVLGGGVASNQQYTPETDHQQTVNITNNVNARAYSGNATVSTNSQAGDARSGNATAGANILNLVHSSYNLDDWFGALFINVLGSWLGNFDIAPDQPAGQADGPPTSGQQPPQTAAAQTVRAVRVFQFSEATPVVSKPALAVPSAISETPVSSMTSSETMSGSVLGQSQAQPSPQESSSRHLGLLLAALSAIAAGVAGIVIWMARQRKQAR